MTLKDTIALSLRNLRQSRLRTALTTLGVSIGIASLAGMVSLGVGLQDQVVGRFMQSGVFDTITVASTARGGPRADFPGRGGFQLRGGLRGRGGNPPAPQTPARKLDDAALKEIAGLRNVHEAYPNLRIPLNASLGEFSQTLVAAGVPMSSRALGAFQTIPYGRFFASESEKACMLSLDLAKRIDEQNPGSLVDRDVTLSYAAASGGSEGDSSLGIPVRRVDVKCRIAGIVERDPNPLPGGALVAGLMIPLGVAEAINAEVVSDAQSLVRDPSQPRTYDSITVKATDAQFTQDIEENLKKLGYSAFSVADALRGAKSAFIILDIFLSLIGSIALAVSSLGIVNTMVMSILERTREIGIMKAIGASDSDIRRIFLFEASVIGMLGGIVGIGLGWAAGRVINFGANLYIQSQGGTAGALFSLPMWLIGGAIGFSIAVSLIAGSYPASRAAKLDPIRALRHD